MRLLELFKGTGSVGKVFKELYPDGEIVSVDILKKYEPTYCGDIMEFDYKKYPVGHFDIIWGSPECKVFSILQNTWFKSSRGDKGKWDDREHLQRVRLEHGKFSKITLDMIEYFQPKSWFIENPWASAMKDLPHFKGVPSIRFDYCRFGFEYQKPTRIWTNRELEPMKCECKEKHKFRLGMNSARLRKHTSFQDTTSINQRYSIPPELIKHLFLQ